MAVPVEVSPGGRHSGSHILDAQLGSDIDKPALGILIEIVSSVIVGDVEIGVTVIVVILPSGSEAEPVVVMVEAGSFCDVVELPVAVVAKEHVSSAVLGIVIGKRFSERTATDSVGGWVVTAGVDVEVTVEIEIGGTKGESLGMSGGAKAEFKAA